MMPKAVWYKDLDSGEFVNLRLPGEWTGQLMLDAEPIPSSASGNQFELGNELRASRPDQKEKVLWLSLKSGRGHLEK